MRHPEAHPKAGEPKGCSPYRAVLDLPARTGQPRRQVQKSFPTLGAARRWVTETREDVLRDCYVTPARDNLADVASAWLAAREGDVRAGHLRTVSLEGYRSALSGVLLHLGDRPVQAITTSDVRGLLTTLATDGGVRGRPLAHRSIVYALTSLRLVLDFAVEARLIRENPADRVKTPRRPVGQRRPIVTWSRDDVIAFRHYLARLPAQVLAEEPWLDAAYRLSLAGLRRSEVLGLTWAAVDFESGVVQVRASRVKTGRRTATGLRTELGRAKADNSIRRVPVEALVPGTMAALKALWLAAGGPDGAALVIRDALGEPVHPDRFSMRFDQLVEAAGVPHLREVHHIRHSLARILHEDGVAPITGASLLGHSVATHLQHYVPNSDEYVHSAADRIKTLFADTG